MLKRTFRAIGIEKCKPLKIFCQPGLLSKIQANFWTRKTANNLHSGTAFVNGKILSEFGRTCRAEVSRRRDRQFGSDQPWADGWNPVGIRKRDDSKIKKHRGQVAGMKICEG